MVDISIDDFVIGGILLLSVFYLAWEYPTHQQREIYFMNRYCMCPPSSSESEEEESEDHPETGEQNPNLVYSSSEEVDKFTEEELVDEGGRVDDIIQEQEDENNKKED